MSEFKQYRKKRLSEMRPYIEGEVLSPSVSVGYSDAAAGSPKVGDMIARNALAHDDEWLVAADYFNDNFELME